MDGGNGTSIIVTKISDNIKRKVNILKFPPPLTNLIFIFIAISDLAYIPIDYLLKIRLNCVLLLCITYISLKHYSNYSSTKK